MMCRELKNLFGLILNSVYEWIRYWRYGFCYRKRFMEHYIALIWMYTHSIEKGLSLALSSERWGFGIKIAKKLVSLLSEYRSKGFDEDQPAIQAALGALEEYLRLHKNTGHNLENLERKIEEVLNSYKGVGRAGGTLKIHRSAVEKAIKSDFCAFVYSRHSIREYAPQPVDLNLIKEAVSIALRTPSACNRQPWRVYVCDDSEKIKRLSKLQGGSRGFGEKAPCFLIITCDISSYDRSSEKNQVYIDGGLFSMSLIYSLHYLGLATCPLQWGKNFLVDRQLRKEFRIKDSEEIILMLTVGHMPEEVVVPQSKRERVEKILNLLEWKSSKKLWSKNERTAQEDSDYNY